MKNLVALNRTHQKAEFSKESIEKLQIFRLQVLIICLQLFKESNLSEKISVVSVFLVAVVQQFDWQMPPSLVIKQWLRA